MSELGDLITICNGRLTLTTGVPVTTSDVTAATTLYFTPYMGDHIALYDGEEWKFRQFEEMSISLSGKTADTNYDVFIYETSGSSAGQFLELVAWTDATNRATALTTQNGVYVKSGDTTKRYLGTIRITSTVGQCEDSESRRFCWNYYNRVSRKLMRVETTSSWTYATETWRYWNNDSANKVEFVVGIDEDNIAFSAIAHGTTTTAYAFYIAIGLDAVSPTVDMLRVSHAYTGGAVSYAIYDGYVDIGYHYLSLLEIARGGTTHTFYGAVEGSSSRIPIIGGRGAICG